MPTREDSGRRQLAHRETWRRADGVVNRATDATRQNSAALKLREHRVRRFNHRTPTLVLGRSPVGLGPRPSAAKTHHQERTSLSVLSSLDDRPFHHHSGASEPHPAPIVSMSLRPGIPWRVALPQSPPPLPRLRTSMQHRAGKANLFPANGNLEAVKQSDFRQGWNLSRGGAVPWGCVGRPSVLPFEFRRRSGEPAGARFSPWRGLAGAFRLAPYAGSGANSNRRCRLNVSAAHAASQLTFSSPRVANRRSFNFVLIQALGNSASGARCL